MVPARELTQPWCLSEPEVSLPHMETNKTPRFNLAQLALLDWLCERGAGERLAVGGAGSDLHLHEIDRSGPAKPVIRRSLPDVSYPPDPEKKAAEKALIERLGGRLRLNTSPLGHAGFLTIRHPLGHAGSDRKAGRQDYERYMAQFASDPFHFSKSILSANESAVAFMKDKGSKLLAELRAQAAEKEQAVTRLVLIGRRATIRPKLPADLEGRLPPGVSLPLPSRNVVVPFAVARVTRQTDQRIYLKDVELIPEAAGHGNPIIGNEPNKYAAVESILVDNVDRATVRKLVAIEADFADDIQRASDDLIQRIVPLILALNSAVSQRESERADRIREVLDALRDDQEQEPPRGP